MRRLITQDIERWKANNPHQPLMVIGVRQIGKTYIINEFISQHYQHTVYLNLTKEPEIVKLFAQDISFERRLANFKLLLPFDIENDNTVVFIDEIQESEEIIEALKFFAEADKYNIITAGSLLGVKIKRFKRSFPVGYVSLLNMYTMSFDEFLLALGKDDLLQEIESCFVKSEAINTVLHNLCLEYYRAFLCIGGMPAAVKDYLQNNGDLSRFNGSILRDIRTEYTIDMTKYIKNNMESSKIESIYDSLPSQLANKSKKFQYAKIKPGVRARDYLSALDWLIASRMAFQCNLVETPKLPLKAYAKQSDFKLYYSDVGLLTNTLNIPFKDIILDTNFSYKGILAENYVANELVAKSLSLFYWKSQGESEIDYLIQNDAGIIPLEVKASTHTKSKSLNEYITKFKPTYAVRISCKNFGFENDIRSVPLYAAFLIPKLF